jgi:hypothetical protein
MGDESGLPKSHPPVRCSPEDQFIYPLLPGIRIEFTGGGGVLSYVLWVHRLFLFGAGLPTFKHASQFAAPCLELPPRSL